MTIEFEPDFVLSEGESKVTEHVHTHYVYDGDRMLDEALGNSKNKRKSIDIADGLDKFLGYVVLFLIGLALVLDVNSKIERNESMTNYLLKKQQELELRIQNVEGVNTNDRQQVTAARN